MRINPIITATSFNAKNNSLPKSVGDNRRQSAGLTNFEKAGIFLLSTALVGTAIYAGIVECKKPPRKSFEEILKRNGLEFKNNVLIQNSTGKNFSGKLQRSTGKSDRLSSMEMIETQVFDNGIKMEETYTDWRGREVRGYFYKDGKIRLEVFGVIENDKMRFGFYDYNKKGEPCTLGDGLTDKDKSIFEWARQHIKIHGWEL